MIPPCDREALGASQFQRKKRWMVSCQLKSHFATSTTIDISLEVCSSLGKQNNMWFTSSFTKALSKSLEGSSPSIYFDSVSETATGDRVAIVAPESLLRWGTAAGGRGLQEYRNTLWTDC